MNKRQWTLVAGHEMWVKLANKSFIISTLTMVVLMAAGIAFGAWQANKTDTMSVVVTTQQAQQALGWHQLAPDLQGRHQVQPRELCERRRVDQRGQ